MTPSALGATRALVAPPRRVEPADMLLLLPGALTVYLAFNSGGYFAGSTAVASLVVIAALALRVILSDAPLAGLSRPLAVAAGALMLYAVWVLLSGAWSDSSARALIDFNRVLLYVGVLVLFGTVPHTPARLRRMLWGLAAAFTVVCARRPPDPRVSRRLRDRARGPERAPQLPDRLLERAGAHGRARHRPLPPPRELGARAAGGAGARRGRAAGAGAHAAVHVLARGAGGRGGGRGGLRGDRSPQGAPERRAGRRSRHRPGGGGGLPGRSARLEGAHHRGGRGAGPRRGARGGDLHPVRSGPAHSAPVARSAPRRGAARRDHQAAARGRGGRDRGGGGHLRARGHRRCRSAAGAGEALHPQRRGADGRPPRPPDQPGVNRLDQWDIAAGCVPGPAGCGGRGRVRSRCCGTATAPPSATARRGTRSTWRRWASSAWWACVLLAIALVALLAGVARRARGPNRALYAAVLVAGLVWVLHAGIDWDWEIPAVTLWLFALAAQAGAAAPAWTPSSAAAEASTSRGPRGCARSWPPAAWRWPRPRPWWPSHRHA